MFINTLAAVINLFFIGLLVAVLGQALNGDVLAICIASVALFSLVAYGFIGIKVLTGWLPDKVVPTEKERKQSMGYDERTWGRDTPK